MKKIIIPLFLILVLAAGCSKDNKAKKLTTGNFKQLVVQAISGNEEANNALQGLVDQDLPVNTSYNTLLADSFKSNGQRYYYVMLEYSNPVYNRYAVYNSKFNLLLLDKSLNGDVAMDFFVKDDITFIKLAESFISKEALSIKRLSLYKVGQDNIKLAFRSFYSLNKPDAFFSQELGTITKDTIVTEISVPENVSTVKSDRFIYSPKDERYRSENNYFDKIIKQQVKDFNFPASLPEIKDEKSAKEISQSK
ncbi:MAG: hypothetical protein ACM3UR_12060 [Bacteroidota bacterium]|jgi:hypothetical protein|nr:hypothetical protein [Ignavibacteria bacterium]MCU7501420.1 hypothetical protein [Ignavibacteria bacterium]MCU7514709.1 hypothetical protein [Ignavibacteria bacterium]MCU7520660.1 hypothetical protein [Ignavibacteria bacterium]MCU7526755.1 hypothetical protein [Ignavibacteria bacterium]